MEIYVLKLKGTKYYKVGVTANLENRLTSYKCHNPYEVQVLEVIVTEDAYGVEWKVLQEYGEYRHRGEWLKMSKGIAKEMVSRLRDLVHAKSIIRMAQSLDWRTLDTNNLF